MLIRLGLASARRPWRVAITMTLATLVAAAGVMRIESVSFLEGNLAQGDREAARFLDMIDRFGSDPGLIIALGCGASGPCETVFDPSPLRLVSKLGQLALAAPSGAVHSVRSLATVATYEPTADGGIGSRRLPPDLDPDGVSAFREAAEADPFLRPSLLSEDLRTTLILVHLDPGLSEQARNEACIALRDELFATASAHGYRLFATGTVLRAAVVEGYVQMDLARLSGLMGAILVGLLAWIFRKPLPVVVAFATVAFPAAWAFGLMGWLGFPVNPLTSMLPILILVVGLTDSIHFLVRTNQQIEDLEGDELVEVVVSEVGLPTTVTAVTSSVGFLSFVLADIPNLQQYGLLSAFGIGCAWLTTFTFTAMAVHRLPRRAWSSEPSSFDAGDAILHSSHAAARRMSGVPVVAMLAVIAMLSAVGWSRLQAENDAAKLMGPTEPTIVAENFIRDHLRPPETLEVIVTPKQRTVLDPALLARLEQASETLRRTTGREVFFLNPILQRVGGIFFDDPETPLPENEAQAAQLLFLAENAAPESVSQLVTPERDATRISGAYAWGSAPKTREDVSALERELAPVFDGLAEVSVTGIVVVMAHMAEVIFDGQRTSFGAALAVIFTILFCLLLVRQKFAWYTVFRALGLTAIGSVPNVVPIIAILGFMGFAGVHLDVGTVMIASIVLGVSVDDTVYFLVHYREARDRGMDVYAAIEHTFAHAGKPALFAALILASGFGVLVFSRFEGLAVFGLLSALAVALAIFAELLFMPAALHAWDAARARLRRRTDRVKPA